MRPPIYLPCRSFLALKQAGSIIDVRSPREFLQGHIPNAVNVPLFSDAERAEVGSLYTHKGRAEAIARGFEFVSPKLEALRQACQAHARNGALRMHCWRGGMRSESMAWLAARDGLQIYLLQQGYKAYRNHVLQGFEDTPPLIILGGYTGSGKTDVLHALQALGEQIVDLEALAHHKGSAFGWLGELPQPSSEQFENTLHHQLQQLHLTKRVWIEDESRNIGRVFVPGSLHARMQTAQKVFIHTSETSRMERLLRDYTRYPKEDIIAAIQRLSKRLGSEAVNFCTNAVLNEDYTTAIRTVLSYYDKRYAYSMEIKTPNRVTLQMDSLTPDDIAQRLITWADTRGL